jgi:hypothetical protein
MKLNLIEEKHADFKFPLYIPEIDLDGLEMMPIFTSIRQAELAASIKVKPISLREFTKLAATLLSRDVYFFIVNPPREPTPKVELLSTITVAGVSIH